MNSRIQSSEKTEKNLGGSRLRVANFDAVELTSYSVADLVKAVFSRFRHAFQRGLPAVVLVLIVHLLLLVGMTANEDVHHWIHGDSEEQAHDCGIKWIAHGASDSPPLASPVLEVFLKKVCLRILLDSEEIFPRVFHEGIFEHAPPKRA